MDWVWGKIHPRIQDTNHMHRDSYGLLMADNKCGDNNRWGWNNDMKISYFFIVDLGFLVDDTAIFNTTIHVIKEFSNN